MTGWRILHYLASPLVGFVLGAGVCYALTQPSPTPKPPWRATDAQVTIAATTLVHHLELEEFVSLSAPPDFLTCIQVTQPAMYLAHKVGVACFFRVTTVDEKSAVYKMVLDSANNPVFGVKVKDVPAPPTA